jgi:predicted nucleic acid-binding Zn ribbon protein
MSDGGGPKRIGDLLTRVLTKYGVTQLTLQEELERVWGEAAGPAVAQHSRPGALRRGVLEVLVDNSVLLQELEGFEKARLLEALKERLPRHRLIGLRFRRA